MEPPKKYPKFADPESYLKCREGNSFLSFIKKQLEAKVIKKQLDLIPDLRVVCDAPSGPGRLFGLWAGRGYRVWGADISDSMVEHATGLHRQYGLNGGVIKGDIFQLAELLPEIPDLVASIRFLYYFDLEKRVELLRALSRATRRYLLVQYKTSENYKGRRNRARQVNSAKPGKAHLRWHFAERSSIEHELELADLRPLSISYVGMFSDRVFVLAEKKNS